MEENETSAQRIERLAVARRDRFFAVRATARTVEAPQGPREGRPSRWTTGKMPVGVHAQAPRETLGEVMGVSSAMVSMAEEINRLKAAIAALSK